jgi:S-adenosylmethionine hydrolase
VTLAISFLSDYGLEDEFVGVCHGVIQRIAPGSVVIDLAHGLPRGRVAPAARILRNALPYLPAGVHLAVVDPDVGSVRNAIAVQAGDHYLVGPDNGLLWPGVELLGGPVAAVEVSASPWRLEPVSSTFHGRDIFAPVAARLALGAPLEDAGIPFPTEELKRLELTAAASWPGIVEAHVVQADRFGNVQLDATTRHMESAGIALAERLGVEIGGRHAEALYARTFADAGASGLLVYEDSAGALALAVNGGDAAAALALEPGDRVRLVRAPR